MAEGAAPIAEQVAIYRRLLVARVRADLQYRVSFVALTVGSALLTVLDFAAIAVIFGQVPQLAGWTLPEVAFLYGTSSVSFALADLFVSQIHHVAPLVREGSFDRLLIRPVGPLLQLSAGFFSLRKIGRLAQAVAVLVLAVAWLDVTWEPWRVGLTALAIAAGAVIFGAVWVVAGSISFWLVESREVANAFTYGGSFLAQYPMTILDEWLRRFAFAVVPIAFVAYVPAITILGKPGGWPWLGLASPAVAAVCVLAARLVWAIAIRHYRSTGS